MTTFPTSISARPQPTWTPFQGLCKATFWGVATAAGLTVGITSLSDAMDGMLVQSLPLSVTASFLVTWILFSVVHRNAGMVGACCTALVVLLAGGVAVAMQAHLAVHGGMAMGGQRVGDVFTGWDVWFNPYVLLFMVAPRLALIGVCAMIRHDGSTDVYTLADIASSRANCI